MINSGDRSRSFCDPAAVSRVSSGLRVLFKIKMNNKKGSSSPRRLFSHRAVFYGVMIEIAGTILVSIVMSFMTRQVLGFQGFDEAAIKVFFQNQFDHVAFMLLGLVPGCLVAGIAGYVAAKTAEQLEYWHALLVVVVVAVIFYGPSLGRAPVWFSVLSLAGISVAALAGAGLCKQHKRAVL